jgi:hypothetical protein
MEPELKAPGANLLTLKYDELLSRFAFNFNLRLYGEELTTEVRDTAAVGRCSLTLSKTR